MMLELPRDCQLRKYANRESDTTGECVVCQAGPCKDQIAGAARLLLNVIIATQVGHDLQRKERLAQEFVERIL